MNEAEMRESVEKGAKLLDEKRPGWFRAIEPRELRMSDCRYCVLGQLTGHFYCGTSLLSGLDADRPEGLAWVYEHGFMPGPRKSRGDYRRLAELWIEQVNERAK